MKIMKDRIYVYRGNFINSQIYNNNQISNLEYPCKTAHCYKKTYILNGYIEGKE